MGDHCGSQGLLYLMSIVGLSLKISQAVWKAGLVQLHFSGEGGGSFGIVARLKALVNISVTSLAIVFAEGALLLNE